VFLKCLPQIGAYFWEEVQFYTNIIDSLLGWLNRELMSYRPHLDHRQDNGQAGVGLSQWLVAYSYLMGSLNYVGGEQAMCAAFHSVVCFSHRETFYYANFTFSAEAVYRLYRYYNNQLILTQTKLLAEGCILYSKESADRNQTRNIPFTR